jgi:class 3 adenylate cyclase/tetratricopeptide (TPR) repeat protein
MTDTNTQQLKGTLTILFTDLEGSTDLRVRVGDAVANEVIRGHDDLVRTRLEQAGAVEPKSLGDGFMAMFSSANQAIEAAVAIQIAIEEHNLSNPDRAISVRVGLNSGDVTQSEGDAHGTAVHAAARICAKAQGGQILASQIVHDLAGSLSDTRIVDRGLFWLKGFPERWRLFEVLWRDKESPEPRATKDIRAASAAAFDLETPRSRLPVVGRATEQRVISEMLSAPPSTGLRAVVLEGEAGIGKTRILEDTAAVAMELDEPYWVLEASADEELRGPFLLFRSLLSSPRMSSIAQQAMALEQLDRAQEAIAGRGSGGEGLSPQEQMLRTFDEVASAMLALTRERPLALLLDDLQWADDDSIQLIRYLVRTLGSGPIVLVISIRPHSDSASGGAGKLIADLDRMDVTKVLRLKRLTRLQTGELLENLLGEPVDDSTLASLHARSEGVPFFIEEFARAYREAEALQLIDGTWTMTRLSGPTVPSSVQSLIDRRLAQLDEDCRSLLADAGVLGRRFRLSDLSQVLAKVRNESPMPEWQLAEDLERAVVLGLIVEEPEESSYDYSFSHDQTRAALLDSSSRQRRRAIHGAIAEMLAAQGGIENLSMLAYHSMKAGDQEKAVESALEAARAAMDVSAPEESVRLIDATLPAASQPSDRIEMLRVKDDALAILDRGMDRLANLAEMTALTGAVTSENLENEVKLRRASASRSNEDFDLAAELAQAVRSSARASDDPQLELAACLELGQAITRSPIGESYVPLIEIDLDAAQEAFDRALELAREIGDRSGEADALRELALVEFGRVKHMAVAAQQEGARKIDILMQGPELFTGVKELAEQALHIYEEVGDKRGAMSSLISMAYAHVTDPTARGMAGRLEHVRALHHSRNREITESQKAIDDAKMLYSIHIYARTNIQPQLALERGREAFNAARALGDRWLECLAAGGVAMAHLSIGENEECSAWLDRAAGAARAVASTSMARRLEMWRGAHAAATGDSHEMIDHFERAAKLAGQKRPAGRCEANKALAFHGARLGAERGDEALLNRARQAAEEVLADVHPMSGELPWESVAHAALAVIAQAEGDEVTAADEARSALDFHEGETFIDDYVDTLWAAARVLIPQGEPEAAALTAEVLGGFGFVSMSLPDPDIKAKWFGVPQRRELADIVGFDPTQAWQAEEGKEIQLSDGELDLLKGLASGTVLAGRTGVRSGSTQDVGDLLRKLGVESETEAIEYAIKAGVTWQ